VLALGTETTSTEAIGVVVVLGVLALLVGFLVTRSGRRSRLRTGSWAGEGLGDAAGAAGGVIVSILMASLLVPAVGRLAAVLLVLAPVAALALLLRWRMHRGQPEQPEPPEPQTPVDPTPPHPIEQLPDEYRFRDGGGSVAGWGIPMAIIIGGQIAFDGALAAGITLGLGALAAATGLAVVFARRRRRQREIIDAVERRAAGLPRDDLRRLVELLEVEHGRFEMRRLRRLVA
jgi:MFS family permease